MALTSGYITLVPEGRNDGSQAVYCLETPDRKTRPVGYGSVSGPFQAVNCLATVIWSLRDKNQNL
jgi:hypothetical protein